MTSSTSNETLWIRFSTHNKKRSLFDVNGECLTMGSASLWTPCQFFILAVALALGTRVYLLSEPCGEDDSIVSIQIPQIFRNSDRDYFDVHPCRAFSDTYEEARSKFHSSARALSLEVQSLVVVPEKNYTIDILVIPGARPGITIHSSGVHGIEGYAVSDHSQASEKHDMICCRRILSI